MNGKQRAVPQTWMKRRGLCHQESFERCRKCQQQHILINLLILLGQKERGKKNDEERRKKSGKGRSKWKRRNRRSRRRGQRKRRKINRRNHLENGCSVKSDYSYRGPLLLLLDPCGYFA